MMISPAATTLRLCFLFIFISAPSTLFGSSLQLVKEIGDCEGIIVHRPSGVVITKEKYVYVTDSKEHYIAKFSWDGRLIKKIGQLGQGPNDLYSPSQLKLLKNKLTLLDYGNKRFAEVGVNLESPVYHKFPTNFLLLDNFAVIENQKFAFVSCSPNETGKYHAIHLLDLSSNQIRTFFDQLPQEVEVPEKKIALSPPLRLIYSPVFGIDRDKKRFIISFASPGNPIEFFIYSFDGKSLDSFDYVYNKNYRVPNFYREGKRPPRSLKYTQIRIPKIFVHRGNYIVFVSTVQYNGSKGTFPNIRYLYDSIRECLIFDKKSKKLKSRFKVHGDLEIFSLNDEGLLSTFGHDRDDNPVVQIYRLEL